MVLPFGHRYVIYSSNVAANTFLSEISYLLSCKNFSDRPQMHRTFFSKIGRPQELWCIIAHMHVSFSILSSNSRSIIMISLTRRYRVFTILISPIIHHYWELIIFISDDPNPRRSCNSSSKDVFSNVCGKGSWWSHEGYLARHQAWWMGQYGCPFWWILRSAKGCHVLVPSPNSK